jgi:hypothetical protein
MGGAVENAFVPATARRLIRPAGAAPLGTVHSLAYFSPMIEEVLQLYLTTNSNAAPRRDRSCPSSPERNPSPRRAPSARMISPRSAPTPLHAHRVDDAPAPAPNPVPGGHFKTKDT